MNNDAPRQYDARQLAGRLAAYVPLTLVRQLLSDRPPRPGERHAFTAATLFADISGFTAMSEQLASDGPRGAEELNRVLQLTFDAMIDVIHGFGGAVGHFHGDAMAVYFPESNGVAAQRALACATRMQHLMARRYRQVTVNRPPHKNPRFHLTIKIGVGYGRCVEMVVGDVDRGLEFVVAGAAVAEAAQAEQEASAGEVVASRAALQQAGQDATADFVLWEKALTPPGAVAPPVDLSRQDAAACARLAQQLQPFIPAALFERLLLVGLPDLAEHRPATSLFVNFRLAEDEDGALHAYYRWADRVVSRFGRRNARINRVLTGDKGNQLHVIFGAPVAPDAPDQALRCALALQRERPSFVTEQRIGVATGKVFAGPIGASDRREYTVVGDVVNVSARLTELCAPGDVLTDDATAERVSSVIEHEAQAPLLLRGRQVIVTPYRILRDRLATTQLQAHFGRWQRDPIGREAEQARLEEALDDALRGHGRLVALVGEPGTGKTQLMAAGVRHWLAAGGNGFIGICQPHTRELPFTPWRNVWRTFFELREDMSTEQQVAAMTQHTLALVPAAGEDVALWADIIGLHHPAAEALRALPADVRHNRFLKLARHCLQAAAAQAPLLIILEGLQWADRASIDLLGELIRHLEGHRICIAVTHRPRHWPTADFLAGPLCTTVELTDLSPEAARQLLHALTGATSLPAAVEQHLGLRDREGRDSPVNPMFLEEAVNVMIEMGVLQINGRVRVDEERLAQMHVPDTIHGLLLARIDRLSAAGREVLQVASVIGRQFALDALDTITPEMPRELMEALLADLSAEELTRLVTADPEWIYLFRHAMTHEVAYESLPYARRQALHAAVADWLMDRYSDDLKPLYPLLAYHYSQANIHEEGLRYALEAAREAGELFANEEAVELYDLAEKHLNVLGVARNWETALEISLARVEVLRRVGDFERALEDVRYAIALAQQHQSAPTLATTYNLLAELRYRQAHFDEAVAAATAVLETWADKAPSDEVARAHQWLGMALSRQHDYERAFIHLRQAEAICTVTHNKKRLSRVLEGIAYIHFMRGEPERALEPMQRVATLSREFGLTANVASALNNIALVQFNLGQAEEALRSANEATLLARETSRNFLAHTLSSRAVVHVYLGNLPEARDDFSEALRLFAGMSDETGLAETHILWGFEYYSRLGRWDEAAAHFDEAHTLLEQRPANYIELRMRLLLAYGQLHLQEGNVQRAAAALTAAATLVEENTMALWRPVADWLYGRLLAAQNEPAQAQKRLQQALTAVQQGGNANYLPLILLELARLESDPERRAELLEQCVEKTGQRAGYLDRIHCLQEAGALLLTLDKAHLQARGRDCLQRAEALRAGLTAV